MPFYCDVILASVFLFGSFAESVSYIGTHPNNTRTTGQPLEFTIGVGQVIRGWDQGVAAMSLGQRAILHIPSDMAYGSRG